MQIPSLFKYRLSRSHMSSQRPASSTEGVALHLLGYLGLRIDARQAAQKSVQPVVHLLSNLTHVWIRAREVNLREKTYMGRGGGREHAERRTRCH